MAYTAHSSVATIHNALAFNHSAIPLPKKVWLTPAIVTTGRDFSTNRPAYGRFLAAGFEPGISGVYLDLSPPKLGALTTRPSCSLKILAYACLCNDGT